MSDIKYVSSQPLVNALTKETAKIEQKKSDKSLRSSIIAMLDNMDSDFKKALPDTLMSFERFKRMAQTAIMSNIGLLESAPETLKASLLTAAQLGLEPNTPLGQAWLIPYNIWDKKDKKWVKACQFQLGYKGLIALAYRSPFFQMIQAHEVWKEDDFEFEYGLNPILRHKPATDRVHEEKEEPTFFYALWKSKNGGFDFQVMSNAEINRIREKFSKTYSNALADMNKDDNPKTRAKYEDNIWVKHYIEMAKKTVIKKLLKYVPLQSEDFLAKGVLCDGTVKTEISNDMSSVKPIDTDIITGTATEIENTEDIKVPNDDDFPPCLGGDNND